LLDKSPQNLKVIANSTAKSLSPLFVVLEEMTIPLPVRGEKVPWEWNHVMFDNEKRASFTRETTESLP
jgi:hypothetical protein